MRSTWKLVPLVLAGALATGACSSVPATSPVAATPLTAADPVAPTPSPSPAFVQQEDPQPTGLPGFSKPNAMRHIRKLARDIGVRVRGRSSERAAALYIRKQFLALGYDVTVQKFKVDGGRTSRNVVASWPGSKPYPFVVGGHMDTVPGSPGANDNASGVAVVLEMARIFAGRPQADLLKFVAFGSEEYGADRTHHIGSEVYVKRLGKRGRERLAGMVSVDMIADGRPLLVGNSGISHPVVARTLYNKVDRAGVKVEFRTLCDCSDNGPFEHAGIPASFAWSGPEPDYHSPTDTVPNLRPDDVKRTGRAMRAFIRDVNRKMLDRFRRIGRA